MCRYVGTSIGPTGGISIGRHVDGAATDKDRVAEHRGQGESMCKFVDVINPSMGEVLDDEAATNVGPEG